MRRWNYGRGGYGWNLAISNVVSKMVACVVICLQEKQRVFVVFDEQLPKLVR
jgi:hypothetical protein